MSSISRLLVTLEMLTDEMAEELALPHVNTGRKVSSRYLSLLKQVQHTSEDLLGLASDFTENGFSDAIAEHKICTYLVNKKVLMVQNKLLEYAVKYYDASQRAEQIRHDEFNPQADIRFDLLSTRAIKIRAQYKTIAKAMKESDYQRLQRGIGLAEFDWGWEVLMSI